MGRGLRLLMLAATLATTACTTLSLSLIHI